MPDKHTIEVHQVGNQYEAIIAGIGTKVTGATLDEVLTEAQRAIVGAVRDLVFDVKVLGNRAVGGNLPIHPDLCCINPGAGQCVVGEHDEIAHAGARFLVAGANRAHPETEGDASHD